MGETAGRTKTNERLDELIAKLQNAVVDVRAVRKSMETIRALAIELQSERLGAVVGISIDDIVRNAATVEWELGMPEATLAALARKLRQAVGG